MTFMNNQKSSAKSNLIKQEEKHTAKSKSKFKKRLYGVQAQTQNCPCKKWTVFLVTPFCFMGRVNGCKTVNIMI